MSIIKKRPLNGLRVVDFGQYIAGPATAMMLADQGAEVVHIDPLEGARWNSPADAILNRGKQRVRLDLKKEEDVLWVKELILNADVVVENFRPGVMKKLGLASEELCLLNPGLVYLSLPGFSEKDKAYADVAAWEGIIAAAVGQFTDMGLNRILMGINPSFSPLPLASAYASVLGATAITLALFAREKTRRGDIIEVPISAALMEGLAYNSMHVDNLPDRYKSPRELEIERRKSGKEPLDLDYADLQEYLDPFYRTYFCKDGRPFYAVCSSHSRHPIACLKVLGLWDEFEAAGIPTHSPYMNIVDWPKDQDCTIISYPLSKHWASKVSGRMKEAFKTRSAIEWQQTFGDAGVPGCAHQSTQEWLNSEHALKSGSVLEVEDPSYGKMRQMGNICWLMGDTDILDKKSARLLGKQDSELVAICERWRYKGPVKPLDDQALDSLSPDFLSSTSLSKKPQFQNFQIQNKRGWLEGLKILDLTNVIAGPTIACTLARFGAEVISIDPPTPSLDPWNTIVFGMQANQGKRSILLDLKSAKGQQVLDKLLEDVDVVTINASNVQLQHLDLSIERLHQINPAIILCQFDAYGGPLEGPRSNNPGYDDLVQATTGIMSRFGGGIDTPEEHAHFGTIDVLGGYCAALAIGVALVNRAKEGGGRIARSSLVAAGQLIQVPFMYDFINRPPFNEPSGREAKGDNAFYRCYRASDGWFFLAVDKTRKLEVFKKVVTDESLSLVDNTAAEQCLELLFSTQSLNHWKSVFSGMGIGFQPLASMSQLRESSLMYRDVDATLDGSESVAFIRDRKHPSGYVVDLIAPNSIRPRSGKVIVPRPMPKYGEDTVTTLKQFGFTCSDIELMLAEGVAATQWSDCYLPD